MLDYHFYQIIITIFICVCAFIGDTCLAESSCKVFYPTSFLPFTSQLRVVSSWAAEDGLCRETVRKPCCTETLRVSKVTPSYLSQHILSFWSQWIQGFPAVYICCLDSKEMFLCLCVHTHKDTQSRCVVCGWELRQHVLSLSETCFSCSEGYSGYLCIISWAGRERGSCPLKKLLQFLFCLSSMSCTPIYIFLFISFPPSSPPPLAPIFQAVRVWLWACWGMQIFISMCYWIFLVLEQKPACLTLSPFALDTVRLISELILLLKAQLFINFLYTIFKYTPGLGNDQSCFLHVALLFLFSYISMENHGVGTGLTPRNQCFQPISPYELSFWIIFSSFLIKTLKMPSPFFFPFLTYKNIAKLSHLQSRKAATWVCWVLAGTKCEVKVREESWVE